MTTDPLQDVLGDFLDDEEEPKQKPKQQTPKPKLKASILEILKAKEERQKK